MRPSKRAVSLARFSRLSRLGAPQCYGSGPTLSGSAFPITLLSSSVCMCSAFHGHPAQTRNKERSSKLISRRKSEEKLTRHDGKDEEKLPGEHLWDSTPSFSASAKMTKNEICTKVSKKVNPNASHPSQSIQQYCNIAVDILV